MGVPMLNSGFCEHPSGLTDSHQYCKLKTCSCECHEEKEEE